MEAKDDLRSQIVALRQAGQSRSEIRATLGPVSERAISDALRGTRPPEWTRRPRAKDGLHAEARKLRTEGMGYNEIAAQLGVSKITVSAWVHDLPALTPEQRQKNAVASQQRFRERERAYRDDMRAVAASEIGQLSDRETIIAGAVAYWCKGSKTKPWSTGSDRVTLIDSDPGLICFFLRFLDVAGVEPIDLIFRVHIHESADVPAAERFWQELTGAPADQFRRTTLKRHNSKTVRKNVNEDYHGCLIVAVRRSGELYREIEGWISAIPFGQKIEQDSRI